MKISRSATLPAGVEDAFAVVETQEYQQAKVDAQAPGSTATVTDQAGGGVAVHTVRHLSTAGMPGVVVSMVGDSLEITEQQAWRPAQEDGSRHADLEITVAGAPVRLVGRIVLSPDGAGSRLAVDADLSCSVPLLGRKIEQAAKPAIEDSIEHEVQQLTRRLS